MDELSLRDMQLNTTHFISDVRVSGKVGELKVKAHGIDLSREHVRVNRAILNDANLLVELLYAVIDPRVKASQQD